MATINGTDRLIVQPGGENYGPYIDLPVDSAPAVLRVLKEHGVRHWLQHISISVDGGPYEGTIRMSRNENAADVQAILDGVGDLTAGPAS